MAINFVQFLANFILAMVLLKLIEMHLLRSNPDSSVGAALAFITG